MNVSLITSPVSLSTGALMMTPSHSTLRQLLRYLVVGGFCATLNFGIFFALYVILQLHVLLATAITVFSITPIGFLLHRKVTFRVTLQNIQVQFIRFTCVVTASLAANISIMHIIVDILHINPLAANISIQGAFAILTFSTHKFWTFAHLRFTNKPIKISAKSCA